MLVAAGVAWSSGSAETPKGGTLRLGTAGRRRLRRPGACVLDMRRSPVCDLREVLQLPGCAGCGGNAAGSGGRSRHARISRDGRMYTFELKRTFRFHTGAAVTARSFADAFNRVANPRLRVAGDGLHARDRRRRRGHGGEGEGDLGRPSAGPLPAADPADQAGGRLHRPADAALLLSDPAEHARSIRPGSNNPPGSGPYYVAERIVNRRIVLKRNPYYRGGRPANVDQVVWTIGESERGLPARGRAGPDRPLRLTASFLPPTTISAARASNTGSTGRAGSSSSAHRSRTLYLAFNHDRRRSRGRARSR